MKKALVLRGKPNSYYPRENLWIPEERYSGISKLHVKYWCGKLRNHMRGIVGWQTTGQSHNGKQMTDDHVTGVSQRIDCRDLTTLLYCGNPFCSNVCWSWVLAFRIIGLKKGGLYCRWIPMEIEEWSDLKAFVRHYTPPDCWGYMESERLRGGNGTEVIALLWQL